MGIIDGSFDAAPMILTDHGGLISLWDMLTSYARIFVSAFGGLQRLRYSILPSEPKFPFPDETKEILHLVACSGHFLGLHGTKRLADDLSERIGGDLSNDALAAKIQSIEVLMQKELSDKEFFYVPKERVVFYNNKSFCGELVAEKFPYAVPDIIEAGNCYALDRPTACVFHLMRVIPYGMEALAKLLKVRYTKPIECLEWNGIIEPINKAVGELQKLPKSSKKFRDQHYYSEIVQHLYFCKDAWRNHVSHAREPYDMPQARSVLDHVSLIMALVSKRLTKPFTKLR